MSDTVTVIDQGMCPICQEDEDGTHDPLVRMPRCGHWIHMKCALQFALYTGYTRASNMIEPEDQALALNCPICRTEQVVYQRPRNQRAIYHANTTMDASGSSIIIVADHMMPMDHLFLSMNGIDTPSPGLVRGISASKRIWNILALVSIGILAITCIQTLHAVLWSEDDISVP